MNAKREKQRRKKRIKTSIYILFMESSIKAHSKSITTNVGDKNKRNPEKRTSFSFRQTDGLNKSL